MLTTTHIAVSLTIRSLNSENAVWSVAALDLNSQLSSY